MTPGPPSAAPAAARRLLILDDDEMVGVLIETIARMAGMEVRLTQQPAQFLASVDEGWPSHIVLDLTMPAMSGEDVLLALAQRCCSARIVISSGAEDQRVEAALALASAAGLHVAGVLTKPFKPAMLREMMA